MAQDKKDKPIESRKVPLNASQIEEIKQGIRDYEVENEIEDDIYQFCEVDLMLPYINLLPSFIRYITLYYHIEKNHLYEYKGSVYNLKSTVYVFRRNFKNLPKADRDHLESKMQEFRKGVWSDYMSNKRGAFLDSRFKPKENKENKKVVEANLDTLMGLCARQYTNSEIMQFMKKEHNVSITYGGIQWFRHEYSDQIEKATRAFQTDSSTIRLTHKSSRLEELQDLYIKLKDMFIEKEQTKVVQQMTNILKNIKEEVEGNVKRVEIDINGNININHALSIDKQQQIMDNMHIYDLIIGRVASKAGKSPLLYISALRNSFYADVVGFGNKNKEEAEIRSLPSDFNFDLDELEKKYNKFEEKQENIQTIELFENKDNDGNKTYKAVDKIALQKSIEESLQKLKKKNSKI
jgi:hypothetical protein